MNRHRGAISQRNWPEKFHDSKRLWLLPKKEIGSERRNRKIPFGVPSEGTGSVFYHPRYPRTEARRLRPAYPSRNWVEVHLDQRTGHLVGIFLGIPRTWNGRIGGFEHYICSATSLYARNASQLRHSSRKFEGKNTSVIVDLAFWPNIKNHFRAPTWSRTHDLGRSIPKFYHTAINTG